MRKVDTARKLRAHAASVAGTPEAAAFTAKADQLEVQHIREYNAAARTPQEVRRDELARLVGKLPHEELTQVNLARWLHTTQPTIARDLHALGICLAARRAGIR